MIVSAVFFAVIFANPNPFFDSNFVIRTKEGQIHKIA